MWFWWCRCFVFFCRQGIVSFHDWSCSDTLYSPNVGQYSYHIHFFKFVLRLICPCCLSHRWWVESNRSVISWGILVTFPPFSLVNFSHFSLCLINKWNKWNQLCRDASRMVLHILWFLFHCKFSMAAMVSYAFWLAKISNLYFSETTYVWKCYIHMTLFKVCVVFVEKKSNMSAIARQIFTLWKNK